MQIFNIHHLKFDYAILQIAFHSQPCILMQINFSSMVSKESEERIRNQVDVAQFLKNIFIFGTFQLCSFYSTDKCSTNNKLF